MTQQYRRKNYFIDKSFQAKFILLFCSVVIISSVLVIGLLLFSLPGFKYSGNREYASNC